MAFSLPPPQPGRASSISGRARQSRTIGASRASRPRGRQIEERRLRPVEVFEDDHEGPALRERLEQPANRPEDLLAGAPGAAEADRVRHQVAIMSAFGPR